MLAEIAYIDDNLSNLEAIEMIFSKDFDVHTFQCGQKFMEQYGSVSYKVILLDIHMPEIDGFALYDQIISHPGYNGCPILFISSDDSDAARIRSFELGAVDFIPRQIHPEELVARVKSKIKFFQKHRHIIEFGLLRINLTLLKTYLGGVELPLTFIELKILCLALRNYPDIISKELLIENVWKTTHVLDATIYTHISNLNGKLKDWDHEINSVKGKGIQLVKKAGT